MKGNTRITGSRGELMAREYLEEEGFEIVQTNYQFNHGEIDIVAREGNVLVFCEVKTRFNDTYGPPEYAVTPRKQRQLRKVAEGYLFEHRITDQECRFDVVAIQVQSGTADIRHIRNAF